MKVSLRTAQYLFSVYGSGMDFMSIPKEEWLKRIGAQLGAVEEVVDWKAKYDGAVIVKVVSCEKHPNADKLHVCRVDDGGAVAHVDRGNDGFVQVVCGAQNVSAGMFAVWLPPGTIVPSSRDAEPFELTAREIRGVVSNGMLASPKELGISDEHEGILAVDPQELGREPTPGDPLTEYYGLDDVVIDCENKMFTPSA
jgi:phenylalanyl-tRNA synthetase beta chain